MPKGALGTTLTDRQLFVNDIYVTVLAHPGRDVGERAADLIARLSRRNSKATGFDEDHIKRLEDAGRDLMASATR